MKIFCTLAWLVLTAAELAPPEDLAQQEAAALQAAAAHVADSVVQIRTIGGLDRVGATMIAAGPTTGLVVTADGYLVSSAFNFAQQPTSILVRLPSGDLAPAQLVAHDKNRMLVLLKVNTNNPLPVPEVAPLDEIRVGQWAVALGRTFQADQLNTSVGIVSALNRMYGRVMQTDANVSVANYGGPLVDVRGRVLGVLAPMAPQAGGGEGSELAGAEYYDSGIGFAVPLADVFAVLDKWKKGADLLPGKLGVGLKSGDVHIEPPQITTVWQGSPAAKVGWQPDDVIISVNGQAVETQAQLRFLLVPRYAGEQLTMVVRRGDEQIESQVMLVGELDPFRHAFLGVLPSRAKGEKNGGVIVRAIWPNSPAARAGIKPADRITKIGKTEVRTPNDALTALESLGPESEVDVVVLRSEAEREFTVTMANLPDEILARADLPSETEDKGVDAPVKLESLKLLEHAQVASFYAPELAGERSPGLVLWLAEGKPDSDESIAQAWAEDCRRDGLVLVVAHSLDDGGWSADDVQFLEALMRNARQRFDFDMRRSIVGGAGKAGQMAYELALRRRSGLAGVVACDAPLPRTTTLPPNLPGSRLAVLVIESKDSSFAPLIRKDIDEFRRAGFPTSLIVRAPPTDDSTALDPTTRASIGRWLDGLDRF